MSPKRTIFTGTTVGSQRTSLGPFSCAPCDVNGAFVSACHPHGLSSSWDASSPSSYWVHGFALGFVTLQACSLSPTGHTHLVLETRSCILAPSGENLLRAAWSVPTEQWPTTASRLLLSQACVTRHHCAQQIPRGTYLEDTLISSQ